MIGRPWNKLMLDVLALKHGTVFTKGLISRTHTGQTCFSEAVKWSHVLDIVKHDCKKQQRQHTQSYKDINNFKITFR